MNKNLKIKLQRHIDCSDALSKGEIVGFNCTGQGSLLVLIAQQPNKYQINTDGAIFPKSKGKQNQKYFIYQSYGTSLNLQTEVEDKFKFHDIQQLNNDDFLLVSSRCYYNTKNGTEKNGRIFSDQGDFKQGIILGDGIQSVQINKHVIWTSFFDEGIFGNYGWNNPIGKSGLVAWNKQFEIDYEFEPSSNLDYMCDCYALNIVSDNEAWCYYYTDFPLVKIKSNKIENYWNIDIHGSDSFAVYDKYILISGGYDDKNNLYLLELHDKHKAKLIKKIELDFNGKLTRIFARKDIFYFLIDDYVSILPIFEVFSQVDKK